MKSGGAVNQNPFLSTLPGVGFGQTIVTMGPCAGNSQNVSAWVSGQLQLIWAYGPICQLSSLVTLNVQHTALLALP